MSKHAIDQNSLIAQRIRQKPRYAAQLKVDVFMKGLVHHRIEKTANISLGGIFLCTELPGEIGDKMHLRIILSDREAFFDIKARIAWTCNNEGSHPQGLGLEFIDLNEAQKDVINKILAQYVNVRLE